MYQLLSQVGLQHETRWQAELQLTKVAGNGLNLPARAAMAPRQKYVMVGTYGVTGLTYFAHTSLIFTGEWKVKYLVSIVDHPVVFEALGFQNE